MGIAFSDAPIVFRGDINGGGSASLLAGIDEALNAVGWTSEAIAGGKKYSFTSKQGLKAKCKIADIGYQSGSDRGITIQFLSEDESQEGYRHPLLYKTGRVYEVTAGRSQMFIAATGFSSDSPEGPGGAFGHAVCGGVPFVPNCLDEEHKQQLVTDCWWSSGTENNFFGAQGFRVGWNTPFSSAWDGCVNLVREGGVNLPLETVLRLGVVSHPYQDYLGLPANQKTQRIDGSPLFFEPMLIWGSPIAKLRAQIWDALLGSKDAPLDDEITTQEFDPVTGQLYGTFTWRNWMHDKASGAPASYYSALYLLKGSPIVESNYAY